MYLTIIILPLLSLIVSGFFGIKVGVTGSYLITCICIIFIIAAIILCINYYWYLEAKAKNIYSRGEDCKKQHDKFPVHLKKGKHHLMGTVFYDANASSNNNVLQHLIFKKRDMAWHKLDRRQQVYGYLMITEYNRASLSLINHKIAAHHALILSIGITEISKNSPHNISIYII